LSSQQIAKRKKRKKSMSIGLIILGVVSVLIFFGVLERFFSILGLKAWLAFVLVIALVVGSIVPNINIFNAVTVNIGAFVVPLVIMIIILAAIKNKSDIFKGVISIFAVASVAIAARMLIEPLNTSLILASSLIIGFVGGAVAFLAAQNRLPSLVAAFGGIALGDIVVGLLHRFMGGISPLALGGYGVFDSIIIAAVFSLILNEAITAIKRVNFGKKIKQKSLNLAEAGQDIQISLNNEPNNNVNLKNNEPLSDDGLYNENTVASVPKKLKAKKESKNPNKQSETSDLSSCEKECIEIDSLTQKQATDSFFDDYV